MESVIATREEIERFLLINRPIYSYGYGDGSGAGSDYGFGYGNGIGVGSGSGSDNGCGTGYGSVSGTGYGSVSGTGYGSVSGTGIGVGSGSGDIIMFNGNYVDYIDSIPTIIVHIRNNYAIGYIVKDDFTLESCYMAKVGNSFAHGQTLKDAIIEATEKEMWSMPVEEKIDKFIEQFPSIYTRATGKEFYDWHHILTGSCTMGRDEFCKTHRVNMDKEYTVKYFLDITSKSYGSDVIKQLNEAYIK